MPENKNAPLELGGHERGKKESIRNILPVDEKIKQVYVKYRLLRQWQSIIRSYCESQNIKPFGILGKCSRVSYASTVSLESSTETQSAFWSRVIRCGSSWTCPVCSSRIMRQRQRELASAIHQHKQHGGEVLHLCLTFQHEKKTPLKESLSLFRLATSALWRSGSVRRKLAACGLIGRVTSTEITFGSSGWHPHEHILLFISPFDSAGLEDFFSSAWLSALSSVGLSGVRGVACRLQDGSHTEKYVSKLSAEMSLSNLKQGRVGGRTFFQLLADGEKDLCIEYYLATKGKSSLQWSRGLKARFGIGVVSDEDISSGYDEDSRIEWLVLRAKDYRVLPVENRSILESVCSSGDKEFFRSLCVSLGFEMGLRV